MKLLFATRNRHKLGELRALIAPYGFEVLSLDDVRAPEVDEDRDTFAGNAEKKARSAFEATGLPSLADDSGLEVTALYGQPGVRSARFAGGEGHDDGANNEKLLRLMADVPDALRDARFRCVLAFVDGPGPAQFTEGTLEGTIARAPRGEHGFGYDPLFLVGGGARTLAEFSADEKNAVSHRGQALRAMANALATRRTLV